MAHKNLEQIKKLLQLLDYPENDIYIHIDAKQIRLLDFLTIHPVVLNPKSFNCRKLIRMGKL